MARPTRREDALRLQLHGAVGAVLQLHAGIQVLILKPDVYIILKEAKFRLGIFYLKVPLAVTLFFVILLAFPVNYCLTTLAFTVSVSVRFLKEEK